MVQKKINIVILGAGFGGLASSHTLINDPQLKNTRITIIDKKNWFMMDLVKLWIIKGERKLNTSKTSLNKLLNKGINFIHDDILKIDTINKIVLTSTHKIAYDYLIISMGVNLCSNKIPGLSENSLILYDIDQVDSIHNKIINMKNGKIVFLITSMPYKCPPAPFEAAFIVNTMLKNNKTRNSIDISFYSPAKMTLPSAGIQASNKLMSLLTSENIHFHGSHNPIIINQNKILFENNTSVSFDLLLSIPHHVVPKVILDSKISESFIHVNRNCETKYDNVYAIGDINDLSVSNGIKIPKAGIFAEKQGIIVAKNIIAKINNTHQKNIFDGKGGCFIELDDKKAGYIDVNMYSKNQNQLATIMSPSEYYMTKKREFELQRIKEWLL